MAMILYMLFCPLFLYNYLVGLCMYVCMYSFNSGNSAHKKKSTADRWTDRQKQTTSTNYKLTRNTHKSL